MLTDRSPDRDERAVWATLALVVVFGALLSRFFYLQIWRHDDYRKAADDNRIRLETRPAPRGIIRARGGEILAENRAIYTVELDSTIDASYLEVLHEMLVTVGGVDSVETRKRLELGLRGGRGPIRIVSGASFPLVSYLEERDRIYPHIRVRTHASRYYRYGHLGAHVIGYLGEVRDDELGQEAGYRSGDRVGRAGTEDRYESFLRGREGARVVEVDSRGREVRVIPEERNRDPIPGMDLYLTLDLELQALADSLMSKKGGAMVALDPASGEVLAMVSKPDYDLNVFGRGRISSEDWEMIRSHPGRPLIHRAIAGLYPPASTWKLVTSLLGLERGLVDEAHRFPAGCRGGYQFGRRFFRCWSTRGHGAAGMLRAFETSCDVYYYQLGQQFEVDELRAGTMEMGMGQRMGIDLPGEAKGFLPSAAWYDANYGESQWSRGVLLNLAIGQGEILATPLQVACLYAAVSRGGVMVTPHILRRAVPVDGDSPVVRPEVDRHLLPLSPHALAVGLEAMERVVNGKDGTGPKAKVPGVRVGGKTGTAENPHGETHAWFVGVAPMASPRIVVACVVEQGGHGGATAAPLVGQLLQRFFSRSKVKSGADLS